MSFCPPMLAGFGTSSTALHTAEPRAGPLRKIRYHNRNHTVFITHLPPDADERTLADLCSRFGFVTGVFIERNEAGHSMNYAFVELDSEEGARQAILQLDRLVLKGPDPHVASRAITVAFVKGSRGAKENPELLRERNRGPAEPSAEWKAHGAGSLRPEANASSGESAPLLPPPAFADPHRHHPPPPPPPPNQGLVPPGGYQDQRFRGDRWGADRGYGYGYGYGDGAGCDRGGGHGDRGHGPGGYGDRGYGPGGYGDRGYGPGGYGDRGYGPGGYGDRGYGPGGYGDRGYGPGGYGDRPGGYGDRGYGAGGYGDRPGGYGAGGYGDRPGGYGDRGYGAGGYDDRPGGYGDRGYGAGGYGDRPGGYGDRGYGAGGYGDRPGGYGDRGYGPGDYGDRGYGAGGYGDRGPGFGEAPRTIEPREQRGHGGSEAPRTVSSNTTSLGACGERGPVGGREQPGYGAGSEPYDPESPAYDAPAAPHPYNGPGIRADSPLFSPRSPVPPGPAAIQDSLAALAAMLQQAPSSARTPQSPADEEGVQPPDLTPSKWQAHCDEELETFDSESQAPEDEVVPRDQAE
jgi:hypothetical protein